MTGWHRGRFYSSMVIAMNKASLAFAAFGFLMQTAHAAEVDITYGQLKLEGSFAIQVIATKNNGAPIKTLFVECGFFQGARLVASGGKYAENIAQNQTAYLEVVATDAGQADRTDCRISSIER